MRRKSFAKDGCPIARSLDAIGDWWSLLIIRDAMTGVRRFSEFQRGLGSAKNVLAARLKSMVAQGIMTTEPASDGSAYQEYVLTAKGKALMPVFKSLAHWGKAHLYAADETPGGPMSRSREFAHLRPDAILSSPARAQASSRLPPGAPAAPIDPTISLPTRIRTPPPKRSR
jgi:DNA-binding HxlR family transcriptional regulator